MIHTDTDIEYLTGKVDVLDKPINTLSDIACHFLNDLSSTLFKSNDLRLYPDLSALAFWCRKSNLLQLKDSYNDMGSRIGRGLCFHVAPSNIPVNFAFSFAFSLLAGNANIVRVPSNFFPQVDFLCKILNQKLEEYPEIKQRTLFVKYKKDSKWTDCFSKLADCRMIWGGDETVKTIKKIETKPNCFDISFYDRYSICILNGKAVLSANEDEMKQLAEKFYKDTYLMDQNACSSPQLIAWINNSTEARNKFWGWVHDVASKQYDLTGSIVIDKYAKFCSDAIELSSVKNGFMQSNLIYRIEVSNLENINAMRGRCGYFYEFIFNKFEEIVDVVTEKFQTITYYGIDAQTLRQKIISMQAKGVDRIVPIGRALDIDIVWDGHDLLRELSRKIIVKQY